MKHRSPLFRYSFSIFLSFAVLLSTLAICNSVLFGGKHTPYQTLRVPQLVGSAWDPSKLSEHFACTVTYVCDADVPAGHVISQSPTANTERTTRTGQPIRLRITVSLGEQTVQMPDLLGSDVRQAREQLQALGLCVDCREQIAPDRRDFTVLSQSIPKSTVLLSGSVVILTYAAPLPQHNTAVPALSGLTAAEANLTLLRAGLLPGKETVAETDADAPMLTVSAQSIPAGTLVPIGTTIDYTLTRTDTLWNFPIAEESSRELADFTKSS